VSSGEHADLKAVLAAGGPMNPARAVNVVRQIGAAIDDAHANQTIHRDVTPASIMLSATDYAYLAGIGATTAAADNALLTYQAPELITNTEVTYRADIYALTAVLYECLTGSPPYRSVTADAPALIDAHLNAPIPRPSQQRADIPAAFDDVIARGLAKNPADRYSSARELAEAAQEALTGAPHASATDRTAAPDENSSGATEVIRTSNLASPTVSHPHSQPQPLPDPPKTPRRMTRRQTVALMLAALLTIGLVVAAVVVVVRHTHGGQAQSGTTATGHTYGSQQPAALPFPGLDASTSVAVDGAGNVYVLSSVPDTSGVTQMYSPPKRLFKLAAGASNSEPMEFPGVEIREAKDMVVDTAGSVYLSAGGSVWFLATGSRTPIRLPFRGFTEVSGIAVSSAGDVYAVGVLLSGAAEMYGVKKLPMGATEPTDLPFTGLYVPRSIAVDKSGDVYVGDGVKSTGKARLLKLTPGANTPAEVPFPGLREASRIAIDAAGDLFVTDENTKGIFELPAGDAKPVKLPTDSPARSVAVDSAGNVYFTTAATTDNSDKVTKPGQVFKVAPN
jgi:serine/threonine protein kinase, bacterial